MTYESTADALTERIVALGPQVLTIDDPWALFKVPGFELGDLQPSFAQANFALQKAKSILEGRSLRRVPPPRSGAQ